MRLGAYNCELMLNTIASNAYRSLAPVSPSKLSLKGAKLLLVTERHRHRYEFNNDYRERFEKAGMIFSGIHPQKNLVEIIELDKKKHPFFVGVQFHPEFQSNLLEPHPVFLGFLKSRK